MSELPESLRLPAELLEGIGRRTKHQLGDWTVEEIAFEADGELPPEIRALGIAAGKAIKLPRITCRRCEAWAQFLNLDGVCANSPTFDQECALAHTS